MNTATRGVATPRRGGGSPSRARAGCRGRRCDLRRPRSAPASATVPPRVSASGGRRSSTRLAAAAAPAREAARSPVGDRGVGGAGDAVVNRSDRSRRPARARRTGGAAIASCISSTTPVPAARASPARSPIATTSVECTTHATVASAAGGTTCESPIPMLGLPQGSARSACWRWRCWRWSPPRCRERSTGGRSAGPPTGGRSPRLCAGPIAPSASCWSWVASTETSARGCGSSRRWRTRASTAACSCGWCRG